MSGLPLGLGSYSTDPICIAASNTTSSQIGSCPGLSLREVPANLLEHSAHFVLNPPEQLGYLLLVEHPGFLS